MVPHMHIFQDAGTWTDKCKNDGSIGTLRVLA